MSEIASQPTSTVTGQVDTLWASIATRTITKKERNKYQLTLSQIFDHQNVPVERRPILLCYMPRRYYEDVQDDFDPDVALDMMVKGMKFYGDSDVDSCVAGLAVRESLTRVDQPKRDKREAKKAIAAMAAELRKNDQAGLSVSPAPVMPVSQHVVPVVKQTKPINSSDSDSSSSSSSSESSTKEEASVQHLSLGRSFADLKTLYSPKHWPNVGESQTQLEIQLIKQFLPVSRSESWEYDVAKQLIDILVLGFVSSAVTEMMDKTFCLLVRFSLSLQGLSGVDVNNAMKKLENNKLPKEFRNMTKAVKPTQGYSLVPKVSAPLNAQAQSFRPNTQSRFNNNKRSNSVGRVPPNVWKILTDEQKAVAKGSAK